MSAAQAQTGRFTLKGVVLDTTGNVLPEATIMLLSPKDSALVNFGRGNKDGSFELKNLKRMPYLLKVSYVGFIPFQQDVKPEEGDVTDAGKIEMQVLGKELYEVVIKTARAPLSIRGDTVEYDPRAFKVPPGSTVEDLIRKLPGMQVDSDGNIKAQGEDVKRVTVDGKKFFGDDPKMATKNLPAEAINKVQVFNGKTEQAKLTGVEDGKREKTLNLELKDSHKKGGFGKAVAGVGTDSRLEGKVSYNRFDDKQQFSVLGFGNNVNQSGIARNDYQDFKGSQSFNWGDDGNFGFYSGQSNDGGDISIQPSWGGGGSQGFSKNYAGGANYNFDNKKTKLSTSYFYNQSRTIMDVRSTSENFLNNETYRGIDNNKTLGFTGDHRPSFRLEREIDSLNTIILISNSKVNLGDQDYESFQQSFRNEGELTNQSTINNISDYNSFAMANMFLYRRKFKKKGRNFALSAGYNLNNGDESKRLNSINIFARDSTMNSVINQQNTTESSRSTLKSSVNFIEPFAKKFMWETFYNFSLRRDKVDRDVFDIAENNQTINPFLTRYYSNDFSYNRLGSTIRYAHNGLNIAVGLAGLSLNLKGKFAESESSADFTRIERNYLRAVPNFNLTYQLKNNRYIWGGYSMNISEPAITALQTIVDNSNPLYISVGNPDLIPASTHSVNGGFQMFNPASFTNFYGYVYYNYNVDQIVYNRSINLESLVTTIKPMNITGGTNIGTSLGFGFPLKKTKSNLYVNTGINLSNNPTFINDVKNETKTDNYNFGLRLDLTPSDVFTLYTNANWNISNTEYSINTSQNQKIVNSNYGAEMNIRMPKDIYFSSNFNYRSYVNNQFGFNQQQPILNLSVYKIVLKSKKGEIRLTANDVFKKNLGISQNVSQNFYTERRVATLSRYFMLSFTYNMRGISASVKRPNF
jgi:hypothetical protein